MKSDQRISWEEWKYRAEHPTRSEGKRIYQLEVRMLSRTSRDEEDLEFPELHYVRHTSMTTLYLSRKEAEQAMRRYLILHGIPLDERNPGLGRKFIHSFTIAQMPIEVEMAYIEV